MIESQQKAIVTFGSKAHAVQFAKQWNRYSWVGFVVWLLFLLSEPL